MTCEHCMELIGRKLEGSLSAEELQALDGHLATCPGCRRELLLQERIAEALGRPPSTVLPADFAERVARRAFRLARAESRGRRWGYLIPVAANAAVLLLAVLYRADIAAVLGPAFGGLGQAVASLLRGAAGGVVEVSAPVKAAGSLGAYLAGILGPLMGAFVVVILASSRIYALRKR